MSLVEKLCKEIGVEVEEVWMGNDGEEYFITSSGILKKVVYKNSDGEVRTYRTDKIERVLSKELKALWTPKANEIFYFIDFMVDNRVRSFKWVNLPWQRTMLKNGAIFKCEEEAIELAYKVTKFIKEER